MKFTVIQSFFLCLVFSLVFSLVFLGVSFFFKSKFIVTQFLFIVKNFEYDENMAKMGDALLKEAEKKDAAAAAAADDDKPTEAPAADTA